MTIANRELVALAKAKQNFVQEMTRSFSVAPEVICTDQDFDIKYQGPEGVIVTAATEEARDFWSNGCETTCGSDHISDNDARMITPDNPRFEHYFISEKYPMLFCLPFTDDPSYARQSANHASISGSAGDVMTDIQDPATYPPFEALRAAAVKNNPKMSLLLFDVGIGSSEMPYESWGQKEFMDHAIERWPQSVNYMPEEYVTPEVFIESIKLVYKGWGPDGAEDIIQETPGKFDNLLTQQQWDDLEKIVPGLNETRKKYGVSVKGAGNASPEGPITP